MPLPEHRNTVDWLATKDFAEWSEHEWPEAEPNNEQGDREIDDLLRAVEIRHRGLETAKGRTVVSSPSRRGGGGDLLSSDDRRTEGDGEAQ